MGSKRKKDHRFNVLILMAVLIFVIMASLLE